MMQSKGMNLKGIMLCEHSWAQKGTYCMACWSRILKNFKTRVENDL